jgi:hypothetical protein
MPARSLPAGEVPLIKGSRLMMKRQRYRRHCTRIKGREIRYQAENNSRKSLKALVMRKVNQGFRKKGLPKILLVKMIGEPISKRMVTILASRSPPILRALTERSNK